MQRDESPSRLRLVMWTDVWPLGRLVLAPSMTTLRGAVPTQICRVAYSVCCLGCHPPPRFCLPACLPALLRSAHQFSLLLLSVPFISVPSSCGLPRNLRGTPLTDKRDPELYAICAELDCPFVICGTGYPSRPSIGLLDSFGLFSRLQTSSNFREATSPPSRTQSYALLCPRAHSHLLVVHRYLPT